MNIQSIFIDKDKFEQKPNKCMQLISQVYPFDTLEYDDVRNEMQNETYFCILLVDREVASICRVSQIDKGVYINRPIVTSEKYQGNGYGAMCLLESEKYLQPLGAKRIISFVDIGNIASWKLHLKVGYRRLNNDANYRDERYCWDTAVVFEKSLIQQQNYQRIN